MQLMPEQASSYAAELDLLFFLLVGLTVVFTVLVGALVIFLAVKYRRGSPADRSRAVDHHTGLELAWSIPPLILGLAVFFWNASLFGRMRTIPDNALEIFVIGKQWMWHLQHPNGVRENNELHVPLGRPIKLTMISQDVIHNFRIPAFRTQRDVIPGTYTQQWFEPTRLGRYRFYCSQFCGTEHSKMTGWVTVMEPEEYERWLANGGNVKRPVQTMAQAGGELYEKLQCGNCHEANSTVRGPSLLAIYGKQRALTNGQTVTADHTYLRESLVDPYAKIVKGYEQTMPAYKDLSEENILQLVEYMKTLGTAGDTGTGAVTAPSGTGARGSTSGRATGQESGRRASE